MWQQGKQEPADLVVVDMLKAHPNMGAAGVATELQIQACNCRATNLRGEQQSLCRKFS